MRLGDLDALKRKLQMYTGASPDGNEDYNSGINDALHYVAPMLIANQPTIDAVPVVRCKDCVFRSNLTGTAPFMYHYCHRGVGLSGEVNDDDFCSYGERKDGEGCD